LHGKGKKNHEDPNLWLRGVNNGWLTKKKQKSMKEKGFLEATKKQGGLISGALSGSILRPAGEKGLSKEESSANFGGGGGQNMDKYSRKVGGLPAKKEQNPLQAKKRTLEKNVMFMQWKMDPE